jgi:hypothetical protein
MNTENKQDTTPTAVRLLNPEFKYVPAAATDITQTWRKFGWQPIERKEKHYESDSGVQLP